MSQTPTAPPHHPVYTSGWHRKRPDHFTSRRERGERFLSLRNRNFNLLVFLISLNLSFSLPAQGSSDAILTSVIVQNGSVEAVVVLSNRRGEQMEHEETGCQAAPEGPILCINNCGFFGSAATMNMCSKCHKDLILKQEQAKLAASSIKNIVNGSSSGSGKEPVIAHTIGVQVDSVEPKTLSLPPTHASGSEEIGEANAAEGPKRCTTCKKRVGLTGFKCRCGNFFCGSHRYSDKHDCPFDYRNAARDAIAKANPVVKAEKLDKI